VGPSLKFESIMLARHLREKYFEEEYLYEMEKQPQSRRVREGSVHMAGYLELTLPDFEPMKHPL
jgi:hypothetical protein